MGIMGRRPDSSRGRETSMFFAHIAGHTRKQTKKLLFFPAGEIIAYMAQEFQTRSIDNKEEEFQTWFGECYNTWEREGSAEGLLVFKPSEGSRKEPIRKETNSNLPSQNIHGFKNEILSLKSFLLNQKESEEFKTLAVVGKYGVGKTALCQEVFNNEDVKKTYVPRVWVCMYTEKEELSRDGDPKIAIVKRILRNLGVEEDTLAYIKDQAKEELENAREGDGEKELSMLLYALHLNLWGKKYLIVLDDARKEDGWKERLDERNQIPEGKKWGTHLSFGFPKGSGGRVIFTTRDEDLAKELVGEERSLHRLHPLSDKESVWDIYKDAAAASKFDVNPIDEGKYKDELMNKSCGIPAAAKALGTIEPVDLEESEETAGKKDSNRGKSTDMDMEDVNVNQMEEKTGSSHGETSLNKSELGGTEKKQEEKGSEFKD
ncbi:PREDICTED: probable disease resistance protein At5g45490 isoform X2 [Tarenaya hassleriana]|nr:PREDICTED: probable disease resistance protein At5g45490 isoform X2 [Tarenaya hassleriana]